MAQAANSALSSVRTPAPGGTATATSAAPSPSHVQTTAPVLPDGRSPVILKSVDVAHRTITFDLIELYLGAQAQVEWKKDHPNATGPGLPGDTYVRNNNTKLRTLPVSTNVVIKTLQHNGESTPTGQIAFEALPTYKSDSNIYWITVVGGTITLFEEQFFS